MSPGEEFTSSRAGMATDASDTTTNQQLLDNDAILMKRLAQAEGLVSRDFIPASPSTGNSVQSDISVTTKAIASSCALVGESLVEPSNTDHYRHANAKMKQLMEESNNNSSNPLTQSRTEWIATKVSSRFKWLQQKREERRKAALERQVDEQRRRLYEAQHGPFSSHHSLEDNATFQQLFAAHHHHQHDVENHTNVQPSKSGDGISVDVLGYRSHHTNDGDDDGDEEDYAIPQVRLVAEPKSAPPFLLSQSQRQDLCEQALPLSIAYSKWQRLYSLQRDGDAFDQFLGKVEKQSHTLLVVKTSCDSIFGAYAESPWESHGPAFYGSAQASLFSFFGPELKVYKWTGLNRYLQLCDVSEKRVAIGGGGEMGTFGLCLENDFKQGSTGPCDTFGNDVGLSEEENFDVVDLEVYGFLLGQF